MKLIDLHTHQPARDTHSISIISSGTTPTTDGTPCSVGIHPWHIATNWENVINEIHRAAQASNVAAIGECGIDKIKSTTDINTQTDVLTAHALIAEATQKPLLLHCVKAQEEIIKLHRSINPKQAWIIHGFRGKPTQAMQLLRAGFFLSYGATFNPESLAITPADRLFIESDTSANSLADIYKSAALCRGVSIEELARIVADNLKRCNINIL